ncbi:glutamine--fructose-6-phosphate transaminase (isomerizing) [Anaerotalea alkaliphila]|uniref:Glutamine--fructose-6-phosphate aminotransferase [isomerizing] n=1 Tax=Anaerotalea alkaliphila TaxID=2662126 RepID=A0A7X5KMP9_9FIRM|nr:glutamine--fructose-6-phosphate transaminase (isomerizing) [Anaerotalea alkaliphila]NDL67199.1 glutamine--fructose-6-phosphate transaminase (isomerizing) [Anaerotalea alkaliphila]
MCGIVGYIGNQAAVPILMDGLRSLEYRGYDSAGVAVYDQAVEMIKVKGRLVNLEERLLATPIQGSVGIGHTRWATHGAPSDVNSHPHRDEETDIVLVHNGIIENYLSLKAELMEEGYVFASETDTEVAVHLIASYYRETKDLLDAVLLAIDRIQGSYAFGVFCKDEPDTIIAARKDSPLVVGLGTGENFIASDIPAILKHTRDVYFLEDGEVAVVRKNSVQLMDNLKKPIERPVFHVTWDIHAAEKGGYDHFMLKEIYEQPKVIRDTLLGRIGKDSTEVQLDGIRLDKETMEKINKVYIVACGTAYYAGSVGKMLLEAQARVPVVADVASEFRYRDPILDENTLMIVVSQSGETADTLAALRMAKKAGARVLGVVNVVGSTIAREADDVFYTCAGPEIAVASTKAYSAQLVAMYLLSMKIGQVLGKIGDEEFAVLRDALLELPEKVERVLENAHLVEDLARKNLHMKNVFYIGRGLDYAAAMEGALKIKEVAYLHAESYPAGELKHGPIALIEEGSLLMGLVGQEALLEKTISNIKEVKARGANVMAIAMEGNEEIRLAVDDAIFVPRTHPNFTTLLVNIPQQLFAYHIACGLGRDVDKPRNLAKSVTVE